MPSKSLVAPAVLALLVPVTACTNNTAPESTGSGKGAGTIKVSSSDDGCTLSTHSAPSGSLVFKVTNDGSKVTEFYLYAADGQRVIGEVENIGPGLSRNLVVTAEPGKYVTACKPGMTGGGIRSDFKVTDSGENVALPAAYQQMLDHSGEEYGEFVRAETRDLLAGTRAFVSAYKHGEDDRARELYATARVHWERIEPVAESFGDLDPKMDARQADLTPGQTWTGWHRLEKDLWPPKGYRPLPDQQGDRIADQLMADTEDLAGRVPRMEFGADQIANGAKELLDEVATTKVTGEEEVWSHTDLYDFQANVDGARKAFDVLRPAVDKKDPALGRTIDRRFESLQSLLDRYRTGDGFVTYTKLSDAQVKKLSDSVNAVAEPLSRLTATVTL